MPRLVVTKKTRTNVSIARTGLRALIAAFVLALAAPAHSQDCGSPTGEMDACIFAELAAREFAASLPKRMDEFQTLDMVVANGRRSVFNIVWNQTKAEMDQMLAAKGTSWAAITDDIDTNLSKFLCDMSGTSDFIRMGGIMQANYRTKDWHPFHTVQVSSCP